MFLMQPFLETAGAVRENIRELLGSSSFGDLYHLFPEGWSYLWRVFGFCD